MGKSVGVMVLGMLLGAGLLGGGMVLRTQAPPPERDMPLAIERIQEVARLETLDVLLFKKVSFEPDQPAGDSTVEALAHWAAETLHPTQGRIIAFANARMGLDVRRLDAKSVRVKGTSIQVVLPPMVTRVDIRAGDTEVIHSNLDAAQVARLLEHARELMEVEVQKDVSLQGKAKVSAQRALTTFLMAAGFTHVEFVESLPAAGGA